MSEIHSSDAMKNLVWFIIGLAVLGIILALVLNFAGMVPVQQDIPGAPQNWCISCI